MGEHAVHAGLARCMGARHQLCHLSWVLVSETSEHILRQSQVLQDLESLGAVG